MGNNQAMISPTSSSGSSRGLLAPLPSPVALDPPRLPSGGLIFPCYAFLVDLLDLSSVDHSPGSLNQGVEYHPCSSMCQLAKRCPAMVRASFL